MCVKIRLESVSVSVSVSVSGWLQEVFRNYSPLGNGYRRPSVTIQTHLPFLSRWLQEVFHNHSPVENGYGKPFVTICSWKQIQKLIQIRGVSGTRSKFVLVAETQTVTVHPFKNLPRRSDFMEKWKSNITCRGTKTLN